MRSERVWLTTFFVQRSVCGTWGSQTGSSQLKQFVKVDQLALFRLLPYLIVVLVPLWVYGCPRSLVVQLWFYLYKEKLAAGFVLPTWWWQSCDKHWPIATVVLSLTQSEEGIYGVDGVCTLQTFKDFWFHLRVSVSLRIQTMNQRLFRPVEF